VPLARVKPLVLRPSLINRDEDEDNLGLSMLLSRRLDDESEPAGRGREAPLVYVPRSEFPGAVRPSGTYTTEGDKVRVRLLLKRDSQTVKRLEIEGSKSDLKGLVEKLSQAVLDAVKSD
jgi:hypothetical protein